ncbi:hypothetical protein D1872_221750 [compost metagenome]
MKRNVIGIQEQEMLPFLKRNILHNLVYDRWLQIKRNYSLGVSGSNRPQHAMVRHKARLIIGCITRSGIWLNKRLKGTILRIVPSSCIPRLIGYSRLVAYANLYIIRILRNRVIFSLID